MIAQKYNDGINNIWFIWVYLVYEEKAVYLLKKPTKLQRNRKPIKEYNTTIICSTQDQTNHPEGVRKEQIES